MLEPRVPGPRVGFLDPTTSSRPMLLAQLMYLVPPMQLALVVGQGMAIGSVQHLELHDQACQRMLELLMLVDRSSLIHERWYPHNREWAHSHWIWSPLGASLLQQPREYHCRGWIQ